ncbi:ShlB/FhaC/HecB family hemolysin secretion/activation protein [Methylophilus rhizosphaerae]|uniref:ShlB/FhaC/HecB family hemolysin secretion/activation protein n=1 Tax=Methylophilus rhizosphaerae TaxID=492660 RepID=UPI001C409E79|nr:ShlB/FhaC/HecB family hemolysin secretion/activation protein [Methylophilus rhizosphaerae]
MHAAPVVPTDAGSVNIPRPQLPPLEVTPALPQETLPESETNADSNVKVVVKAFEFSGNEQFSTETLSGLLTGYIGREVSFAELNEAVTKVKQFYRNNGYFLAQVVLPAQDLVKQSDQSTVINIQVIEGKLGELKVEAGEGINQSFMSDLSHNGIASGDVITEQSLVRNVILINALPGVRATSILSPGAEPGTSDATISVEPENKVIGYAGINTYGNPYTGRETAFAGVAVNNLAGRGDQLTFGGRISRNEDLKAFNIGYATPVFSPANVLSLGYSLVEYSLNGQFKDIDAKGNSQYFTAYLDRSMYRDSRKGVNLRLGGIYKELKDEIGLFSVNNRRDIAEVELGVSGEWITAGGDVMYQLGLSATGGHVSFKDSLAELVDRTSLGGLGTQGDFMRVNLIANRNQIFENGINWALRADYQAANQNLDIAEKMGIGAVNRWRQFAYLPSLANEGWMVGTEVKKDFIVSNPSLKVLQAVTPYAFYDFGNGKINHDPLSSDNHVLSRHYGVGVDFTMVKQWVLSTTYSIQDRAVEGAPTDTAYTLWGQLKKDF